MNGCGPRVRAESIPTLQLITEDADETAASDQFSDERLKLLFVCAHPVSTWGAYTFDRAIGLSEDDAVRQFLLEQRG